MRRLERFYENLPGMTAPKSDFVERVAARCGVEVTTVRTWVKGKAIPLEEKCREILAEETGIAKEMLF